LIAVERIHRNGQRVAGFDLGAPTGLGQPEAQAESPWKSAAIASVVGVATGWVLEEIARHAFKRKRK
jgi:hypothetical protein